MDISNFLKETNLYSELRWQTNRVRRVGVRKGDLVVNQESESSGVSCRSFNNGVWGMSFSSEEGKVADVIRQADQNAKFMAGRVSDGPEFQPTSFEHIRDYRSASDEMDQKALIDFAKSVSNYIESTYGDLKSHQIVVSYLELEKNLATSAGSRAHHHLPRTVFACELSYEKDGEVVSLMEATASSRRPEANFLNMDLAKNIVDKTYDRVKQKSEGVFPSAGLKDVIIGSDVTGVLVHEAIGHPSEADLVEAGSVTANYVDKKVANENVTIVDFANHYQGQELPIPVYIDDEGSEAQDISIIENGVFKGYMTNRETSVRFDMPLTGSARAYGFDDEPLIRMRNTVLLPGDHTVNDMIASIEDGYYFLSRSNGQADLTSEFMFGVPFGYEIKNGKLGRALKDTTISGVAFDMLKTVDMVGDDFEIHSIGMCGKKQPMMVSHGGPSVKCKVHVGGQ